MTVGELIRELSLCNEDLIVVAQNNGTMEAYEVRAAEFHGVIPFHAEYTLDYGGLPCVALLPMPTPDDGVGL